MTYLTFVSYAYSQQAEIALAYIKAINLDVHSNRCEVPESKRILATNLHA